MKTHLLLGFLFILHAGCGSKDSEDSHTDLPATQVDWTEQPLSRISLAPYGIEATMETPASGVIYNIMNNGQRAVVVQPSQNSPSRMNIVPDNTSPGFLQAAIEQTKKPDFRHWVVQEPAGGVYAVIYPDSILEFRFDYIFKVQDRQYRCLSDLITELSQHEAEAFYRMAKSITPDE